MSLPTRFLLALLTCTVFLGGCGSDSKSQEKKHVVLGKMELSNGWARPGAKGQNSAAYVHIENGTATNDTLLSVTSKVAEKAQMHESYQDEQGRVAMRPAGQQAIASGDELAFEPGGLHIMLINLKRELAVGDSASVTLSFAQLGDRTITLPVKIQQ